MKNYILGCLVAIAIVACKTENNGGGTAFAKAETALNTSEYQPYGAAITTANVLSDKEVAATYANLKEGDTVVVAFKAPINSVCASKGCWMRLGVAQEEEVFVKFKDYGFFVPLDAKGEAVVAGKAYLEEVSVAELQHMAEDAGKTKDEIAAITTPQRELRFMADGVLIKND